MTGLMLAAYVAAIFVFLYVSYQDNSEITVADIAVSIAVGFVGPTIVLMGFIFIQIAKLI